LATSASTSLMSDRVDSPRWCSTRLAPFFAAPTTGQRVTRDARSTQHTVHIKQHAARSSPRRLQATPPLFGDHGIRSARIDSPRGRDGRDLGSNRRSDNDHPQARIRVG
jgi:hypothetical protein